MAFDHQSVHWSGKSERNFIFLQGQGKVRKFSKIVREILNAKKVWEESGNFLILGQNCLAVAGILSILSDFNDLFFLVCFAHMHFTD